MDGQPAAEPDAPVRRKNSKRAKRERTVPGSPANAANKAAQRRKWSQNQWTPLHPRNLHRLVLPMGPGQDPCAGALPQRCQLDPIHPSIRIFVPVRAGIDCWSAEVRFSQRKVSGRSTSLPSHLRSHLTLCAPNARRKVRSRSVSMRNAPSALQVS